MSDPIKRAETTHICEVTRTAAGTTQWFAENRNRKGAATHPITDNNKLTFFICGEESFADIAAQVKAAKESIDLICWGFDPGMELARGQSGTWPRGETYGDLLIAAGKRGVKVRLLAWYDWKGSRLAGNLPGHSHGKISALTVATSKAKDVSANLSLEVARLDQTKLIPGKGQLKAPVRPEDIPLTARAEYCDSWFKFALAGELAGIMVRTRHGNDDDIYNSLKSETDQPGGLSQMELEKWGMAHVGTHHQKTILIDYGREQGSHAVGYVMGLNSVTDFWDTTEHRLEDPRREQGSDIAAKESVQAQKIDRGFRSMKPYRDYICRIDGGSALIDVARNFGSAWERAGKHDEDPYGCAIKNSGTAVKCEAAPPSALLRKAKSGDSIVQIVRTQPEEQDKSIKEVYFQATDIAALAGGYLYMENQYFQYEEWARRLMQKRKDVMAGWNRGRAKAQKSMEDMPVMHVFIVIPVPERSQMIPRTHDTLATLGQQGNASDQGLTGQNKLIKGENERFKPVHRDEFGVSTGYVAPVSAVVEHANSIAKPDAKMLENTFGLKVSVAMLQTCGVDHSHDDPRDRWRYREVYIHSKLMLVNDGFLTLGSANLNQRSMATDSEINIATNDPQHARDLRHRVWTQLSGGLVSGGGGTKAEIAKAFKQWTTLMDDNRAKKYAAAGSAEKKKMQGFLLPLEDNRSSTMRLT